MPLGTENGIIPDLAAIGGQADLKWGDPILSYLWPGIGLNQHQFTRSILNLYDLAFHARLLKEYLSFKLTYAKLQLGGS